MAQDRFIVIHEEGIIHVKQIIVDRLTGVNYLRSITAKSESMVPLYDPYGKPIVSPIASQRPPQMPPQMPAQMSPQMPPQIPVQRPPYMPPQ